MLEFEILDPRVHKSMLGYIPEFLSAHNAASAKEQFDANYAHGGGWNPMPGWTMTSSHSIQYPGDPPLKPIAVGYLPLSNESVFVYPRAFVAIVKGPRGSFTDFEVARLD